MSSNKLSHYCNKNNYYCLITLLNFSFQVSKININGKIDALFALKKITESTVGERFTNFDSQVSEPFQSQTAHADYSFATGFLDRAAFIIPAGLSVAIRTSSLFAIPNGAMFTVK